jgi:hypothetical protein
MEQTTDEAVVHDLQSNWRKVSSTHDLQVQSPAHSVTACLRDPCVMLYCGMPAVTWA